MSHKPVIGLLGGGQLGRMLCEASGPLGIEIAVLDEEKAPAKHAANLNELHLTGSFKDPVKIKELASQCDVLTVEIEHINTEVLEDIATNGVEVVAEDGGKEVKKVAVHPSWKTLRLIQDKYLQKEHFQKEKLPISEQMAIESGGSMRDSLKEAGSKFGYPLMLKVNESRHDSASYILNPLVGKERIV